MPTKYFRGKSSTGNHSALQPYSLLFSDSVYYSKTGCPLSFHCRKWPAIKLYCYPKGYLKWLFKYWNIFLQKSLYYYRCLSPFFFLLTHLYFMHSAKSALNLCSEFSYFILLIPLYVYSDIAETQREKIAWSQAKAECLLRMQGGEENRVPNM